VTEPKRGPGRPRKATPIRTKEGHSARVWVEREGEHVRATVKLGTKSKVVATARKNRLLAGEAPELLADKSRSFAELAEDVIKAKGLKDEKRVLGRLRRHVYPLIGDMPVTEVTSVQINEVLAEVAAARGGYTGTVRNVRDAVSAVLGELVERRVLDINEALRIKFKAKGGKRIRRVMLPRPVLTDDEFERLVEGLVGEIDRGGAKGRRAFELLILCLGARIFGMRTSDLHAWIWEMIDTASFADAYVPRPKTESHLLDEPEGEALFEAWRDEPRSALPAAFGRWLEAWWVGAGRPSAGAVFVARKGKRAGQPKKGRNYVEAVRAALWRFGITRPQPGFEAAATDDDRKKLCELQSGIARRRSPVDFHSFRRAAATAAGKAAAAGELSLRAAMLLTHHSNPAIFAKYQAREDRIVVPESAVPRVMAAPTALLQSVNHTAQPKTAVVRDKEVDVKSARSTPEARDLVDSSMFSHTAEDPIHAVTPRSTTERQNSLPLPETLTEAIELAVRLAMSEGDLDSADALLQVAKRRRATPPDNVSTIDSARRRKS
jgi:hypothetical protein